VTPAVASFFEPVTCSIVHVAIDLATRRCAVIDPVLGFDVATRLTDTALLDRVSRFIDTRRLEAEWILETHVHADHLSGAWWLAARLGAPVGIGAGVIALRTRLERCGDAQARSESRRHDRLLVDGERLEIGASTLRVLATPGHTPGCVTYLIGGFAFVGDALVMPDYGTGRADFPGGDARTLYRSIRRLLALPDATRILVGHDYLTAARSKHRFSATVAEQRRSNVHVHDGITEQDFVAMREARDRSLTTPVLMGRAVPWNLGRIWETPEPGPCYGAVRLPVNVPSPKSPSFTLPLTSSPSIVPM
jgi:glyoxylase-like metal-dependent hydrolase (beta-lactamase superfamily II)